MRVNQQRLRSDIESNAEFGAVPTDEGRGRTVLSGSEADRRAREFFCERLRDAGLSITIDEVGNIVGRWVPESADPDAAPVATGSHLDSVPEGGIFDGPLGVYAGLESVRAMQDAGIEPVRPVEVVNFTEEEGQRFGGGLIGSAVAVGELSVEEALDIEDADGIPLGDALADIGYRGDGRVDAADWDAWIELHIEQSERLEDANVPAGVVTSIVGLSRCAVEITGEADHAGSTLMDDRSDALAAASEFVLDVERATTERNEVSETAVGTVGKLEVSPNAPNVIAGKVDLTVDIRDVAYDSIEYVIDEAAASLDRIEAERPVEAALSHPWDRKPVEMSERCRAALHDAGTDADLETLDLHSGAGHDTMHVAAVTDAALLFAPSRDGISHNPREWTDWEDCADATRVLAGALADLATE
ncbi:Zn-dependent hydrolase [Haloferax sp. Atlit-10N]|uniref:N-carbamyol-L-amino acid amidohydrolase n=1 Tax=Haloferax prahovense (strain DSM 18310 / JCM 13924 / TL6) TaxID=1227461 RepID=M0GEE5_HALPT|nr:MULTISPECIES: Zn-dependent hydrolase [Haloferax]ELZ69194.1 N-carbamyol-L-amino acid amidohydrolase [Haloferax prahovense DSM 18310]RDZ42272.1 Zn-dependent hydrolase [Haloferax sp. Atlit-19N]RDZ42557.1 Zn-dependent hydrolase [Haloferax sp. Atlit-16N]RDZ57430.1 Zn-dependent hydrolase [Haloferax sp. Atlit-10N]